MSTHKQDTITFKVDDDLAGIIRRLPNRSDFIRKAILHALDNACPLCQGAGILTPSQKKHWDEFLHDHQVTHCDECDSLYISCQNDDLPHDPHNEVQI